MYPITAMKVKGLWIAICSLGLMAMLLLINYSNKDYLEPDQRLRLEIIESREKAYFTRKSSKHRSNGNTEVMKPSKNSIIRKDHQGDERKIPPEEKNWMIVMSREGTLTQELKEIIQELPDWIILLYNQPKESNLNEQVKLFKNVIIMDEELRSYIIYNLELQKNTWTDQNIAYLFAIRLKANVVMDTNDHTKPDINRFILEPISTGLIPKSKELFFNPLGHFGQSCATLKGFPSPKHASMTSEKYHKYSLETMRTPEIQYGIRSQSNDITFRSEDQISTAGHTHAIDLVAPPVIQPRKSFTPFHSTVSLTHFTAFWTLLVPEVDEMFSNSSMAFIIKSCIQQKLLSFQNSSVMFVGMKESRRKNAIDSPPEINEAFDAKVDEFVQTLTNIDCPDARRTTECLLDIYSKMLKIGLISKDGFSVAQEWFNILQKLRYTLESEEQPKKFTNFTTDKIMLYYSKEQVTVSRRGIEICSMEKTTQAKINDQIQKEVCNSSQEIPQSKIDFFHDILVIQVFTSLVGSSLKSLNVMYRHVFPNMLICGDENSNLTSIANFRLSFIPSYSVQKPQRKDSNHSVVVDCVALAMKMGYHVSGYLITHDDLILNFWNFQHTYYDKNKVWTINDYAINDAVTNKMVHADGRVIGNVNSWYHIQFRDNITNALKTIHASKPDSELWNCKVNFQHQFPRNSMYYYGQIDLFYWPTHLAKDFAEVSYPFIENLVWSEISFPNIMKCIVPMKFHLIIQFGHEYTNRVLEVWKDYKFKVKNPYFHPFKMNAMFANDTEGKRKVFCKDVLPEIRKH